MARTILIATIIDSVRSSICLLWLNVATAMRMIVIGSVVITTNVLTKAIILPSIFNILVSLFLDAKLAIILITCCAGNGFLSPFLSNSRQIGAFSSQFLENSLQIPCTFRFLYLPLPSLQFTMWSIPHEQRARRYVQAQPTFSKRCGLIFLPITCRIDTEGRAPFVHVEHSTWCGDAKTEYGGSPSTCFFALCGG